MRAKMETSPLEVGLPHPGHFLADSLAWRCCSLNPRIPPFFSFRFSLSPARAQAHLVFHPKYHLVAALLRVALPQQEALNV